MAKALASIWPETFHRLCIWPETTHDFSKCIYDFGEEEDFMNEWNMMLKKYDLEDNDWLKRMFKIKDNWAFVYGRETFSADMTTTQRSETMNCVMKRYKCKYWETKGAES
ncbi:hypothetical protein ACH5RR_009074 [Cinchona calisaya]|uniref:Protein FAR1-RELATED SEQUENCE n=1 Tax=Cinchona calisaya TaxID=153742 RepID=A0ABD3ADE5_9GENT